MLFAGREYTFVEEFDCNLTLDYENDRWEIWHIIREIVSNALDSVDGNADRISIYSENEYINIADDGPGYMLFFAKRIGASSKRQDYSSIGQFGEGLKLATLTCLRKGIEIRIASQDWLIVPKAIPAEEGMRVLAFDIYKTEDAINGSTISIENIPEISKYIENIGAFFLHFGKLSPLHGSISAGIFPKVDNQARLYIKGVFIKEINALFSYGITLDELNRDRDLIDEDSMRSKIRDIWVKVDDEMLIRSYFEESYQSAANGCNSTCTEFEVLIQPLEWYKSFWRAAFHDLFSEKGILHTDDLATKESILMGYKPVKLDYYGRKTAEHVGIERDVDVVRADYEFKWAEDLTRKENERLSFFTKVAQLAGLELPRELRVFDDYAKSEWINGVYDPESDRIALKRDVLNGELVRALDTFLHEVTHKNTGADDYSRSFADGLTDLAAKLSLALVERSGYPVQVKLSSRGFQMPPYFCYSGETMLSRVALLGNEAVIQTAGATMRAVLPIAVSKPYCSERMATLYKCRFYVNIPASIREALPKEVTFYVVQDLEQI